MSDHECIVCRSTELTEKWGGHWNSPTGATIVAWSCGDACSRLVESARTAGGRLTTAAVRAKVSAVFA